MTRENIETVDLIVFLAVARTGSFSAAAGELLLATPSVSARMSGLEQKLSTELFVRSKRGSPLTPAGQRLVPYARRTLEVLHDAHEVVRTEKRERLTVAAPASLGAVIFPTVLELLSEHSLRAHGRVAHSAEVIAFVLDGTAAFGLALSRVAPAGAVLRRLCRSELITVCRPDHPLAGRRTLSADDLLSSRVAVYRWGPDAEGLAETFEHPRRAPEKPVHFLGLPAAAIELALTRDYIAVVPAFAAVAPLRAGTIAELALTLPGWSLDVQLVYRRDLAEAPAVQALLAAERTIVDALVISPASPS